MADAGAIFSGGVGGAAAGAPFGPPGVGIGAGLGMLAGFFGSNAQEEAAAKQKAALEAAMRRLQSFSQQQYNNRMMDLRKTMAYYGPSENALIQMYGAKGGSPTPGPTPGPGPAPGSPNANALAGLVPPNRANMAAGGRF